MSVLYKMPCYTKGDSEKNMNDIGCVPGGVRIETIMFLTIKFNFKFKKLCLYQLNMHTVEESNSL